MPRGCGNGATQVCRWCWSRHWVFRVPEGLAAALARIYQEYRTIYELMPRPILRHPKDPVPRPTPAAHLRCPSAAPTRHSHCRISPIPLPVPRHCLVLSHSPSA
ncbi:hypothetical protein PIB30_069740 [Stylosanthes scabra]|uniref:Uncharacterized protein n=1 Tax=Stylosanthes scabra TaxID=79078 RepID=A0ABU6RNA3_9FABA|nr:hypothetical protein [Stylosanthes scabra]